MHGVVVLHPAIDESKRRSSIRDRVDPDVVPLEGLHECLSHAVAFRAFDRGEARHEVERSLSVAHKTRALATRDLERVVVDTTVQPKAIAHPTDARLCRRALEKLVDLAQRHGVTLRQSYRRVAKRAAIMVGRYTHAHQFKRARRELKFLRTRLARVIRDLRRKIAGDERLEERFAGLLALAVRVRFQDLRQRGPKAYALHAPEVECIGKGKAKAP